MKFFLASLTIIPTLALAAQNSASSSQEPELRIDSGARGALEALCQAIMSVRNNALHSDTASPLSANLYDQLRDQLFELHNRIADIKYVAACKLKGVESAIQILDGLASEKASLGLPLHSVAAASLSAQPESTVAATNNLVASNQETLNEMLMEQPQQPSTAESTDSTEDLPGQEEVIKLPEYRQRNFLAQKKNQQQQQQLPKKTFRIKKLVRVHRKKNAE